MTLIVRSALEKDKSSGSGVLELIGEGAVFSLMDYVNLMFHGDIREYLRNTTDYHPFDC